MTSYHVFMKIMTMFHIWPLNMTTNMAVVWASLSNQNTKA